MVHRLPPAAPFPPHVFFISTFVTFFPIPTHATPPRRPQIFDGSRVVKYNNLEKQQDITFGQYLWLCSIIQFLATVTQ
jgi:hypothetical protein